MANKILRAIGFGISVAVFVSAILVIAFYIFGPAEGYFHSDSTDTIFWAEASYVSGLIFNPDFTYAAMLPIGGNLLMQIWMPFYGVSLTTHALGMFSFLIVLAGAMVFFFRSWRFSWTETFLWTGTILLILSCSEKMREMFWGHVIYYSIYVVFLLVGFGLLARLAASGPAKTIKNLILLFLVFLFAVFVALDGLQLIFIVVVPIAAAIVLERWLDFKKPLFAKANIPTAIVLGVIAVGVLVGLVVLAAWKGDQRAGYADAWYGLTPINTWMEHLLAIPVHWITLLGGSVPTDPTQTFVIAENFASLGFALFIAVFPLCAPLLYGKSKDPLFKVFVLQHFLLSTLILLAVVFGSLGAANWRWIPVIASALFLSVLTVREIATRFEAKRVVPVFAALLFIFAALNGYEMNQMDADYGQDNLNHRIAAELESRGLTYGYADFWISQAVTVISGGDVKVRSINVNIEEGVIPYYYQSAFSWFEDQEGVEEYFLILNSSDYNKLHVSDMYAEIQPNWVETISFEGYYIIIFNQNVF
ncbi:MAG: hypothetical protein A2Y16_02875 [Tenericutes bacterium GWF2_57_13]|nr:MAG: hypothetical protein A2Y16_02875 [Tenericutes bacterium GWF2_57_13]